MYKHYVLIKEFSYKLKKGIIIVLLLNSITCYANLSHAYDHIYYTHNDHLGSASWITRYDGKPIQYIHYLPYGQLLANQMSSGYDERFKFIGKERDVESGYDFFGARSYCSPFKHWLSPDPLSDKDPGISSYAYCRWNPVRNIDIDGADWYEDDGTINWTECKSQQEMDKLSIKGKYLGEAFISFEGSRQERFGMINGQGKYLGGDNPILADVTLYGPNGPDDITRDLVGFTMTSDYNKYGAIADGWYRGNYDKVGKRGAIPSHWALERRGKIPTLDNIPNPVKTSNYYLKPYKDGIFIHSTLKDDNRVGSQTSQGCLLLDWKSMDIFNSKMHGVQSFGVCVIRDKK